MMNTKGMWQISIERYEHSRRQEWDECVKSTRNATFLHLRSYMDYHQERFQDHSLMVYVDGRLEALLPANADGRDIWSHQGLTYGGLLTTPHVGTAMMMAVMDSIVNHLADEGFHALYYKSIPYIYHRQPAEEDLYALWRRGAQLTARDIASVVVPERAVAWRRDRRYNANKACTDGVSVVRSHDYKAFWQVLDDNLWHTYGVHPVHSLEEMELLAGRFPDNIRLYEARHQGEVVAGTVLYLTPMVAHAQYISATPDGKHLHAVDALYRHLLTEELASWPYIDFGKSTENQGLVLNESLIYQKEGFGGRGVCYDTYTLPLDKR